MPISYILCDIEGTTTDIRFVHNELFPFAYEALENFFIKHPHEHAQSAQNLGIPIADVVTHLRELIDRDVKDPELKRIQGKIWAVGYASGKLKGHVYDDVPIAFKRWQEAGLTLGIYSSGSVRAQKLIYGHSIAGDLRPYLSDHFDLAMGFKYEPQSYYNILESLNRPAQSILFLSDVEAELDAARSAKIHTIRLFRDRIEQSKHPAARNFDEIDSLITQL